MCEPLQFDKNAYREIRSGDVVWLKCCFLSQFCQEILPTLTKPVVLLISDGDESFPTECGSFFNIDQLLKNPWITHIFAQNNVYLGTSNKVSHVPIGLDFHTVAYRGTSGGWGEKGSPHEQEAMLNCILSDLKPTCQRKKRIFVDFQLADTMHGEHKRYLQFGEDRQSIFRQLLTTGLIDYGTQMRRSQLWQTKGAYAFSVSPHGNGLDCHRTWEDLVLGCIVIVKASALDKLYAGLPVVIVKNWSEITSNNLDKWLLKYGDAFTNPSYREKLTTHYWLKKIQKKSQFCKTKK